VQKRESRYGRNINLVRVAGGLEREGKSGISLCGGFSAAAAAAAAAAADGCKVTCEAGRRQMGDVLDIRYKD
jgi:hypothetical protein